MSKDLAISIWKSSFVFFSGVGNKFSITSINKSIFLLWCADTGTMGASSSSEPLRNSFISLYDSRALSFEQISILLWTTINFSNPIISSADKCSRV